MFLTPEIKVVKAIDMEEEHRLSTGSSRLDSLLGGGLPSEGIVEITGGGGCGKSQFCMQLTLTVQYPISHGGFAGSAMYICTEEQFQSRRLYEMMGEFPKQFYRHYEKDIDFGENILVQHLHEFGELHHCLKYASSVIENKNVKLIIIDSVTAVFRSYARHEWKKRVRYMRSLGTLLLNLSADHKLLVICVNQVSQSLTLNKEVPALGLLWSNLVNTRILLSRNKDSRYMDVVFSPNMTSKKYSNFSIVKCGIL